MDASTTGTGGSLRARVIGIYGLLAAFNGLAWLWALYGFRHHPLLLGTSLLAYTLGLRHAVDADHIAAIDNVTRALMQKGRRPVSVGFYFSLGHSTVVILASVAVAVAATALNQEFEGFQKVGGVIGTCISSLFLLAIAAANLFILKGALHSFRRVRRGGRYAEQDLDALLAGDGPLARLLRPMFRMVRSPWRMYPLGILFGLGFDTATQIGLLGISAAEGANDLSVWSILVFPVLFTAGMSLVDTTDGVLMLGAYGWAFIKPIRKLYYNLTMTAVSVVVALVIGGVESLGLVADQLELKGGFWDVIGALTENFGTLGLLVIGIFVTSWLVSVAVYRWRGFDDIDVVAE